VYDVLEALASGWSPEEVAENYRIPMEAVHEALGYALETLRKLEIMAVETTGRRELPWPLVRALREMGLDVLWVPETEYRGVSNSELLDLASPRL